MMRRCWRILCLVMALAGFIVSFTTASVLAHVQNEKNLYSDIEYSEATQEIVLLHGIGVISMEGGANVYKPFELLTKSDLAFWAGSFHGLGGEDASVSSIREAALREGLIDTLEGLATYADVNQAYFAGKVESEEQEDETLTREEFALYMATFFTTEIDGMTLFDMAEYTEGPTGIVTDVEKFEVTEGGNTFDVFRIHIDGEWVQVSNHPKILNGPVDLSLWKDKAVVASWYAKAEPGNEPRLEIIQVGEAEFTEDEIADVVDSQSEHAHGDESASSEDQAANHHAANGQEGDGEPSGGSTAGLSPSQAASLPATDENTEIRIIMPLPIILIVGLVLLAIIFLWLFMRRK